MLKKLPLNTKLPLFRMSVLLLLISTFGLVIIYVLSLAESLESQINTGIVQLENQRTELETNYNDLSSSYEESLYENHLTQVEQESLKAAKDQIEQAYNELSSKESGQRLLKIESLYDKYNQVLGYIERNKNVAIDTTDTENLINNWGIQFLNKEYDSLEGELDESIATLEDSYTEYLASLPTPTPTRVPQQSLPAAGYSYQSVSTSRGTFGTYLIKLPLSQYIVKTVSANSSDCASNCPAKPLAEYISENNAYAGMNGTYFCPPDYSTCDGKGYSYDFALYNSNLGKWLNQSNINQFGMGLAAFNGSSPLFLKDAYTYAGQSITAGIVNFPSLLTAGEISVNESSLTSYQKDVRGVRGIIGTDGTYVYLALVSSATVPDTAYVLKALGATYALNLDGGGSSAMYINGAYRVGPGRLLPNVVLIVPK